MDEWSGNMSLKIFHTGDIHLGMKFNGYEGDIRCILAEARFLSLENMIRKSNELDADIFVIAGDLFNTTKVSKKDIKRSVSILDKFNGACVLVLPGNHDYHNEMMELWDEFTKTPSEKILLIHKEERYHLDEYDLDVVVYPAPCHSKHSQENSLGWIKKEGIADSGKYHIGVAHGALEGLSPDMEGNYYYMSMDELNAIPTDLWLIGHTHVRYPLKDRVIDHKIYNAGTPEPDGLDYSGEGSAWFIKIDDESKEAEKVITGQYRFFDENFKIRSEEDLDEIMGWILKEDRSKNIIRLNLEGRVSKDIYSNISEFYNTIREKVFHLFIEDNKLKIGIDEDAISREFTKGSFPYEFLNGLKEDEEALQIAYDLLRRE